MSKKTVPASGFELLFRGALPHGSRVLELKDLSLLIPSKPQDLVIIGDVSVQIPAGHFVAVVGPSGCGKSTLLKLIAGLTEPSSGHVIWEGRDLEEEGDLAPHEIGYVPQFSIAYDLLTVAESVETTVQLRLSLRASRRHALVKEILEQVGMTEIADRPVRVLSGGQRRRLALALEIVTSPRLLLCDEVTSGLDPKAEDELVTLMRSLARDGKRTVLSVTHSLRHLEIYDSVIVLHEGHLAYHGSPDLLTHYFQIGEPSELYPQLALRRSLAWHRSWTKHRKAYEMKEKELSEPEAPAGNPKEEPPEAESETGLRLVRQQSAEDPEHDEPRDDPEDGESLALAKTEDEQKEKRKEPASPAKKQPVRTPGIFSQTFTLLSRRWKLFFRDPSALWLQLSLVVGFPCLVVIFALDGLPQIQNLSMTISGNVVETLKENISFSAQASRAGSLVSGLVMFQVILLTLVASNNGAREIAGERLVFEKEKFGGLSPLAYIASKAIYLLVLVVAQSCWMALFVKMICRFPGDLGPQLGILLLVNAAMTAICLAISSFARTAEQASLISIYLVGFQLPLSGAVLALPQALGWITRPFIAAYWGWSGYLQTLRETRFYEVVTSISQTSLSPSLLCFWVLAAHVVIGLFIALVGCRNSRWPQ